MGTGRSVPLCYQVVWMSWGGAGPRGWARLGWAPPIGSAVSSLSPSSTHTPQWPTHYSSQPKRKVILPEAGCASLTRLRLQASSIQGKGHILKDLIFVPCSDPVLNPACGPLHVILSLPQHTSLSLCNVLFPKKIVLRKDTKIYPGIELIHIGWIKIHISFRTHHHSQPFYLFFSVCFKDIIHI